VLTIPGAAADAAPTAAQKPPPKDPPPRPPAQSPPAQSPPAQHEPAEDGGGYDFQDSAPSPVPRAPNPLAQPSAASPAGGATPAKRKTRVGPPASGRPAVRPAAELQPELGGKAAWPPKYVYGLLALALIPLVFSLLGGESDVEERADRTVEANPDVIEELAQREEELAEEERITRDEFLDALPEKRIEGAHLSIDTRVHWVYAAVACVGFVGLILLIFPWGRAHPAHLLAMVGITGTLGVASLLIFQWAAHSSQGMILHGRNAIALIAFYVVKFIGFSYAAASDPDANFMLSFLGFTCGVGFCEELTKALPILLYYRNNDHLRWRGACMWGLASGVGFGVAEGLIYSGDYYNGVSTGGIYVVRFVSCVALHAVWAGAVGITAYNQRGMCAGEMSWGDIALLLLIVLGVPMVLHGLYDTFLKRDLNTWALLTAAASFAWLVWLIERNRTRDPYPAPTRAFGRA